MYHKLMSKSTTIKFHKHRKISTSIIMVLGSISVYLIVQRQTIEFLDFSSVQILCISSIFVETVTIEKQETHVNVFQCQILGCIISLTHETCKA